MQMSSLTEITVDSLNGIEEEVEEWEELESLVDSGAGTTVIGPEDVRAVKASDPDPSRTYKLADGSLIPNRGHKCFVAHTGCGTIMRMNTNITDVEEPLLSVSQMVTHGATVVFSPDAKGGSYIESNGNYIPLEYKDKVYKLKMWIPRDQPPANPPLKPFPGQH